MAATAKQGTVLVPTETSASSVYKGSPWWTATGDAWLRTAPAMTGQLTNAHSAQQITYCRWVSASTKLQSNVLWASTLLIESVRSSRSVSARRWTQMGPRASSALPSRVSSLETVSTYGTANDITKTDVRFVLPGTIFPTRFVSLLRSPSATSLTVLGGV